MSIIVSSKFGNIDLAPSSATRTVLSNLPAKDQEVAREFVRKRVGETLDSLDVIFRDPEELQKLLVSN